MSPDELGRLAEIEAIAYLALARASSGGGPSPGGDSSVVVVAFAFGTTSPLVLKTPVTAATPVVRAGILITTPFNGSGASLAIGTPGAPGFVMPTSDNLPSAAGQYETDAIVRFTSSDTLQLAIAPGTASQGAGFVYYELGKA